MAALCETELGKKISDGGMLVQLSISSYMGNKTDRTLTEELKATHSLNAFADVGEFRKKLFPTNKSLKRIGKFNNAIRKAFYTNTLAWSDQAKGADRYLPTSNLLTFKNIMNPLIKEVEREVQWFIENYAELKRRAKEELGSMYRESDYKTLAELETKFAWRVSYKPVSLALSPQHMDFIGDISDDLVSEVRSEMEEHSKKQIKVAMDDAWQRLHTRLEHIKDTMNEEDKVFRDSLVDGTLELCGLLTHLNITNDSKMERARTDLEKLMTSTSPSEIRDCVSERQWIAEEVENILDNLAV